MHSLNFPDVHSTADDIVIEFIGMRYSCHFGTREMAKRMKVKTIETFGNKVCTTEANEEEPHFGILVTNLSSKKLFVEYQDWRHKANETAKPIYSLRTRGFSKRANLFDHWLLRRALLSSRRQGPWETCSCSEKPRLWSIAWPQGLSSLNTITGSGQITWITNLAG